MFERSYEGAEPVILDEDQSAVVRREVQSMLSALHYLAESLAPVQRQLVHSILYVSEARLAQLGALTGVETDSAADRERRHTEIRAAHERVRELERQLGGAVTAEQTKQAVAHLIRKVEAWWRREGLGHVRETVMDGYGMTVTLSCMLFGTTALTDSSTPVSDKANRAAWLKSLEDRGFVLAEKQGNIGNLAACDASRDALVRLVQSAIPSAQFHSISTRLGRGAVPVMSEVRFYIPNLEDVTALPDVAQD
jgi:hypothetical protein